MELPVAHGAAAAGTLGGLDDATAGFEASATTASATTPASAGAAGEVQAEETTGDQGPDSPSGHDQSQADEALGDAVAGFFNFGFVAGGSDPGDAAQKQPEEGEDGADDDAETDGIADKITQRADAVGQVGDGGA